MTIKDVADFYNNLLKINDFSADVSNNGLQVCGDSLQSCRKVAFAVDACLESFEKAAAAKADMLIVHHGLSWGGEPRRWTDFTGRRFDTLFRNNLALYAMHLPLDAHEVHGNNAQLANLVALQDREMFFAYHGMEIGVIGDLPEPATLTDTALAVANGQQCQLYAAPAGNRKIKRAAIISGGGGMDGLLAAIDGKADVLITGEFDHTMYHVVKENPVHVIALGHYNSEVHGVKSLQRVAEKELKLATVWLDCPSGL